MPCTRAVQVLGCGVLSLGWLFIRECGQRLAFAKRRGRRQTAAELLWRRGVGWHWLLQAWLAAGVLWQALAGLASTWGNRPT